MSEKEFVVTKRLASTGGHVALIIPKDLREIYELKPGDPVKASFEVLSEEAEKG